MAKCKILFILLFVSAELSAQWNYDVKKVESTSGSYKDLGKKAAQITTNYTGTALDADDDNSAIQQIGFDFKFNGQAFSTFVLNTNGFIKLGSIAPSSKSVYYTGALGGGNSVITVKDSNLIYPFNRNLIADKETQYSVLTIGKADEKVCTIQFKNLADKINPPQYTATSFQIKLYEKTGIIEFVYGEWISSENPGILTVAAVGVKGNGAGNSINIAKGSTVKWDEPMWQSSKPYMIISGDYSTKGPNFGNKNSVLPDAGHVYRFIPLQ